MKRENIFTQEDIAKRNKNPHFEKQNKKQLDVTSKK